MESGYRRRLFRYGILLFFLGLAEGGFVQAMRNPAMGLSAHVGTVMSGLALAVFGALWNDLRLSQRAEVATFWMALCGMYFSSAGLVLAAVFGTGRSTPIRGVGMQGAAWQEAAVDFALITGAVAALLACSGILWGLRQGARRA